ncbi:CHAT domain-containing protein [Microcoleus sp. FACHB-SPT15]|uniref:CHAT domain-containing protein n=1 Tax=Microcoleus sp. FACHB-SPT15 TaxID=2692830 RepID=UPI0028C40BD6|nr:CHAT domain-containing protein [Microcoleus sp. FACHB-SPT15]
MASAEDASDIVETRDRFFTSQFEKYFGKSFKAPSANATLSSSQTTLQNIEQATGVKPAVIYVTFVPQTLTQDEANSSSSASLNSNIRNFEYQLELVLVTPTGAPIRKRVEGTTRAKVLRVADQLRLEVTNVRSKDDYLFPGKQLYQWMIAPLEAELKAQGIQNLGFVMDVGLRSLPIAALYDGQEFLIEKYSVGLLPSLTLTDTSYTDIKDAQVLAMGAEKFTDLRPLPAVPVELSTITSSLWKGESFLDDAFTLQNLKAQRKQRPYGIIHLATHAVFRSGAPKNSYIQLWDTKLRLDQLSQLGWNNPPVELLVLSACKTALGDEEAELGFAGLAVQAGAKSVLASLWSVSDEGTLGLMTQMYEQLRQAPIKAEALRQTQLAMLKGQVQIQGGQLVTTSKTLPLPPELVRMGDKDLKHPYYWASFTMVGSPW